MIFHPQCRVTMSVVFDGFGGSDSKPTVFTVIPRSCRVQKNNYKEADTFDVTFDGKQLPISPEQIRGAGVEIYIYTTKTLNAAPDPNTPIQLAGLIDNAKLRADDKGLEFSCSGRDYTGLLIDRQWDPSRRVPVGDTLVDTIQKLADEVTSGVGAGRRLTVRFIGEDAASKAPVVGTIHDRKTKKRGFTQQGGKNYWDVIYNLCVRHGFIVFVRGVEIVISTPRALILDGRTQLTKVVYGKNLSSLEVERKLGKEAIPQIVCRSYDPRTRKVLEAKYPEKKESPTTGIGTKKDEQRSFTLPGVSDLATLKRAAKNAYHALSRGEGRIRIATPYPFDLDGTSLLDLEAGKAISIGFEPFIPDAVFQVLSRQDRIQKLRTLGYNSQVAALVSDSFDKLDYFRRPFYTTEATIGFDAKSGISVEVEAQNFISEERELKAAGEAVISGVKNIVKTVTGFLR